MVPAAALFLGFPRDALEALAIGLAIVAVAGLLIVGTAFWRGVDRRVRFGDRRLAERALDLAERVEKPLIAASGLAIAATLVAFFTNGWTASVIASAVLSLLAVLEYINYYQRQLQHFDNVADFKRLITGKGLKTSHMARDLAVRRKARSARERISH